MADYTTLTDAELSARVDDIRSQLTRLAAIDRPTAGQSERHDNLTAAADAIEAEQTERARMRDEYESRRQAAIESVRTRGGENGFHGAPTVMTRQGNPFAGLDADTFVRSSVPELVGRARTAVERAERTPDKGKELLTSLLERPRQARAAAQFALAAGSPAYERAFLKVLRDPVAGMHEWDPEEAAAFRAVQAFRREQSERAAMSTTVGNGGYLIPQQLDPTIVLSSDGSIDGIRSVARVEQGFSNQWEGATSAGVTAEWKSEGAEVSDGSPTFTQKTVPAHSLAAYAFGSYEVLGDTNLEGQLPRLFADAKANAEADAFAIGSGSGAPTGVVTAVAAVTASRVAATTAGTIAADDVYSTIAAVPPRHRPRSSWVANFSTYTAIRKLDDAGGSSFWTDLSGDTPARLIGRPVVENSEVAAITSGADVLVCGDFSEYLVYDRLGSVLMYEPIVKGSSQRPTGQAGWLMFSRVGGDVLNANAFAVLRT